MRLRILFIGNFLSQSLGTIGPSEELAQRLQARGWQVFTTSSRVGRIPRFLDMIGTVWRQAARFDLAHIDVYSGPAFFWAEATGYLLAAKKKPYLVTLHGGNLPNFAAKWPGRVKRLLNRARAVTTPSQYLYSALQHLCPHMELIPNAIELERYPYRSRSQPAPRLIWLRAFRSIYQPELAPQVIAALVKDFPDIHLTMIGPDRGDGSWEKTLVMARDMNILDRIALTGKISKAEVPAWLDRGDVFLNTTTVDNTPVSVMEAMAVGLCVVSTNVGGIPYLLQPEHDSLLVPPGDPEAMAVAVRRLLTEPGLAARLSQNARRRSEQWDWAAVLPKWERVFQQAFSCA